MWRWILRANTLSNFAQISSLLAVVLSLYAGVRLFAALTGGFALLLFVGSLVAAKREQRWLASRIDAVAKEVDLNHVLRDTARSLGLGGQAWRLTLYRLEFENGSADRGYWEMEARVSDRKVYEISRDLSRLTLTQGVLRTAMLAADQPYGGTDETPMLPDPELDPDIWQDVMSGWGFADSDFLNGMRSRRYCGRVFRVGLSRGRDKDMTLGLVAESGSVSGVKRQVMEESLTRPVFESLYELMRLREDMRVALSDIGGSIKSVSG